MIPLSIQYVIVDGFTGLGKVQLSLPLSFFRKLVYFLPLFLLPRFFGARATFYAEPISDIIAPVVSIFVYAVAMKRILKKPVPALPGRIRETPRRPGTPGHADADPGPIYTKKHCHSPFPGVLAVFFIAALFISRRPPGSR